MTSCYLTGDCPSNKSTHPLSTALVLIAVTHSGNDNGLFARLLLFKGQIVGQIYIREFEIFELLIFGCKSFAVYSRLKSEAQNTSADVGFHSGCCSARPLLQPSSIPAFSLPFCWLGSGDRLGRRMTFHCDIHSILWVIVHLHWEALCSIGLNMSRILDADRCQKAFFRFQVTPLKGQWPKTTKRLSHSSEERWFKPYWTSVDHTNADVVGHTVTLICTVEF